MTILRKIFSALLAISLIGGTVYLGILSGQKSAFVPWFGIASATAAPIGLALLGSAISPSDSKVIQQLAKVPEIEKLILKAQTQEEKIQVLEAERQRLAEIVKIESRRQAILDRVDSLERDAVRILSELDNLDKERENLEQKVGESSASEEIRLLRERVQTREEGDIIIRIGSRIYRIDRDLIKALPFGLGSPILAYFGILKTIQQASIYSKINRHDKPNQ
ncbi:MAG: hypothetical protein F6K26_42295 [Moorea sp. SIO2I5]|nr:hypothetical protein [Moorena sp. SIO2I5]